MDAVMTITAVRKVSGELLMRQLPLSVSEWWWMIAVTRHGGGGGREGDPGGFLEHVFLVLARYDALAGGTDRGGGFQGVSDVV